MLSYVVIHRCADKKLHDNKLNMQNVTVNTVFASEETGSMSDLLSINNVKSEHSLLGEVFESGLTRLAKATTPKHHFDSALVKKLPLYAVTCIE